METRFGTSRPYSIGIEEELQLVDATTLALSSGIESILRAVAGSAIEARVAAELHQPVVELTTGVAATVSDGVDELAALRERVASLAAADGVALAGAGSHPFSPAREQPFTRRRRYVRLARDLGWVARSQVTYGLHVHVGVASAEKAVHCARGLRNAIPVLLALSASSPFWEGERTGHASTRVAIASALPRSGIPPAFDSFAAFEEAIARGVRAGCFPDCTHVWWDVRPHPELGTVEVRICDAQADLRHVAGLAALVQSLAALHGEGFDCEEPLADAPQIVLEENRRRAARDGLAASLATGGGTDTPVGEAVAELLERCRPAAMALGCEVELDSLEDVLEHGTEADRQLRTWRERESLGAVAEELVERTARTAVAA